VKDLALDSLDTVELVMAFEDEFAIEIPAHVARVAATKRWQCPFGNSVPGRT